MGRTLALTLCLAACSTAVDDKDVVDTDVIDTDPGDSDADTDVAVDTDSWDDWDTLSFDHKLTYMTDTVLPQMQQLFDDASPRAIQLSCATCHGTDALAVQYAMPNDLYPLQFQSPTLPDTFDSPEQEAWAYFMRDDVSVTMAALLKQDFDDEFVLQGTFTCLSCHVEGETDE